MKEIKWELWGGKEIKKHKLSLIFHLLLQELSEVPAKKAASTKNDSLAYFMKAKDTNLFNLLYQMMPLYLSHTVSAFNFRVINDHG